MSYQGCGILLLDWIYNEEKPSLLLDVFQSQRTY